MRISVRRLLAALVLSGLTGVPFAAAGQSHAPAPPLSDTRMDSSAPVREFQPPSPPQTFYVQPMVQPGSGPITRSVKQDPEGTKLVPRTVVKPPATERCTEVPNPRRWGIRTGDILASIKRIARKLGIIQALRIPDQLTLVKGMAERPAGWAAYAFAVPGKGTLRVTLSHPNEGWFRLLMMDKWGGLEKGMLQNVVHTGKPQVSFKNPKNEAQLVFVLVDDPGWMSSETSLYSLTIDRDWEPGILDPKALVPEAGVWAVVDPVMKTEEEMAAALAAPAPATPKD